jgi:RNA polymerase primary sigma factor
MNTAHNTTEDSLGRYYEEIGRHPLLDRAEERQLARRAEAGDDAAKRRLVESNLRLVVAIARRYRGLGLDLLDLIQEGNVGLLGAIERYDWRQDVKFSSYAGWWIRRAITRALSTKSRLIRLPVRLAQHSAGIARAEAVLVQQLGRRPSSAEVAQAAGVDEELVADVRESTRTVVSLSEPVGEEEGSALGDLVGDADLDPAAHVEATDERGSVIDAFAVLGDRSRQVLELRFGTGGGEPRTLDDVAHEVGLSRERVRKIEAHALQQLSAHPDLALARAAA